MNNESVSAAAAKAARCLFSALDKIADPALKSRIATQLQNIVQELESHLSAPSTYPPPSTQSHGSSRPLGLVSSVRQANDTISSSASSSPAQDLAQRCTALGLDANLSQLDSEGYTVVTNIASPEFTSKLRETCIRLAKEGNGHSAGMLLNRDPIFVDVVTNPKLLALVEKMCGQGALLSQLVCGVRKKGAPALGLHSDQNWHPAPFPEQNQLFTCCWVMDTFDEPSGATLVCPGTHKMRRHPNAKEIAEKKGAIPIMAEANSLACWDGSVWHGNYPRSADGERVVLHITFSRLANRPVENYDFLGEDWLKDKPAELRVMLGREDFLGKSTLDGADYSRIPKTFAWARM